jgi:hypothetical protein
MTLLGMFSFSIGTDKAGRETLYKARVSEEPEVLPRIQEARRALLFIALDRFQVKPKIRIQHTRTECPSRVKTPATSLIVCRAAFHFARRYYFSRRKWLYVKGFDFSLERREMCFILAINGGGARAQQILLGAGAKQPAALSRANHQVVST